MIHAVATARILSQQHGQASAQNFIACVGTDTLVTGAPEQGLGCHSSSARPSGRRMPCKRAVCKHCMCCRQYDSQCYAQFCIVHMHACNIPAGVCSAVLSARVLCNLCFCFCQPPVPRVCMFTTLWYSCCMSQHFFPPALSAQVSHREMP